MSRTKLADVSDIVFRRLRYNLKDDLVAFIYATYLESGKVKLSFILGDNRPSDAATALAVRYNHTFAEPSDSYVIEVLNKDNHFNSDGDCFLIWSCFHGFLLLKQHGG